jgi:hypothetical protein
MFFAAFVVVIIVVIGAIVAVVVVVVVVYSLAIALAQRSVRAEWFYTQAEMLGGGRRMLSAAEIAPRDGIQPGDLYAGQLKYTGDGSKCAGAYGGGEHAYSYADMHARVVSVTDSYSGQIVKAVVTLNYASAATGEPYACIVQSLYSWNTYYEGDGIGGMNRYHDQAGVEVKECTSGVEAPDLGCVKTCLLQVALVPAE